MCVCFVLSTTHDHNLQWINENDYVEYIDLHTCALPPPLEGVSAQGARRTAFWAISDSDASSSSNYPMPTEAGSSSISAFISPPKPAPKPKAKPKPKPKCVAPEREFTEEECKKENKKTEEQIL